MAERYDFYVHDNRKITFNLTEPIMREDSGVTDFVFHIPKVLNELEVSDWQWWLVFVNAKKEKYSIALNLSDDPESPLEKNVATYTVDYAMSIKAGSVQFALEAINAGTGGAIDNEWHTQSYEIKVKETLQGNQAEYAETESDIISALLEEVRTKMNQVIGGATPTPVASVSAMTDPSKLYLLTTDGEWYYHNGTQFVSGGVYGAGITDAAPTQGSTNAVSSGGVYSVTSAMQADIDALDSQINGTSAGTEEDITNTVSWNNGGSVIASNGGVNTNNTNYSYADIPLDGAVHVHGYTRAGQESDKGLCFLDSNGAWILGDYHAGATNYDWDYSIDVPSGATTLRISCATSRLSSFTCILTLGASDGLVADVTATKDAVSAMRTATASDVGKALKAKTVTNGKVVEWEFGEAGGAEDYSELTNKPSINNIPLSGNKTASDLGLASASELANIESQINGSDGRTQDITSSVQWTSGGSVEYQSGGIDTSATNYSWADIPLNGASRISGYTRAGQEQNKGLCFLTSDKTYITGSGDYHAGASNYDWNYDLTPPANAEYMRISCATSRTTTTFTCFLTFAGEEGLADKIEAIEEQLSGFDTEISNPSDGQVLTYDATSGKWVNGQASASSDVIGITPDYYWVDGYFISKYYLSSRVAEGTYVANASRAIAIVDVHAFAGGRITGHTRLSDDALIAFYDHNDIYISSVALPSGASYDFDFDIAVPDNAKKVKISCGASYKSGFSIKGYNLISGINNSAYTGVYEYDAPAFVHGLDNDKSDFHYDSQTRLQDMYTWFDILASTFPRNITKVKIGESTTPEGTYATIDSSVYDINGYIIQGDNYISGNDFIIASGIHGDESSGDGIQSVVSVAYFIRDMLFNPGKNKYLSFMKWNCKILVIPVMNPWGYQNGKRCNGRGVDCNRNFDLNWADSTSYGYSAGTSAFSENESSAVATYISENFSTAKYCTELHTRGGNVLPDDDRWWTKVTTSNTVMQNAVTDVGYYLRRIYGGIVSNGTNDADEPTFRAYTDAVIGIPTNLTEFAKSCNSDITTFNSDSVQIQYVQYLGAMTQKLVETYVMS